MTEMNLEKAEVMAVKRMYAYLLGIEGNKDENRNPNMLYMQDGAFEKMFEYQGGDKIDMMMFDYLIKARFPQNDLGTILLARHLKRVIDSGIDDKSLKVTIEELGAEASNNFYGGSKLDDNSREPLTGFDFRVNDELVEQVKNRINKALPKGYADSFEDAVKKIVSDSALNLRIAPINSNVQYR